MTKETTVQGRVGKLQKLLNRMTDNREELGHLEPSRARFEEIFGQIQEAANRQASYTASKQEASQQLQGFLTDAERLATVLQLAVKQHYGIRAEKLADFGLKPFRGRPRKGTAAATKPAKPTPAPTAAPDPE
ncbi:MAG TPA: hypothetical protein DD490_13050 [Acidobacteria bacterium]|nr:hypothetical protein [Acidobacteriota bacterium]